MLSRRRLLGAAAGLGLLGATGCSAQQSQPVSSGEVELRFWTHDPSYVATFESALTDPTIMRGSPFTPSLRVAQAASGDLLTRTITQAIGGGATADLLGVDIRGFPRVMKGDVAQHLFMDLGDVLAATDDEVLRTAPYTTGGRVYGLESDTSIALLYYRPDVFAQAGLPVDVETWDEFLDVGARLHAATGQSVGMASDGDNDALFSSFAMALLQRGGSPFDADGNLTIDTLEAVEALDLLQRGIANGAIMTVSDLTGGASGAAVSSGRLASLVMPTWYKVYGLQANAPEQAGQWRLRTLPRFAGGGHIATDLGGTGFTVSATSPQRDAALDLLRRVYLTPEGQLLRFRIGGFLPTLRSLYSNPELLSYRDPYLGGQEIVREYARAADDLPTSHQSENLPALTVALGPQILGVYRGDLTPAQAIRAASESYARQVRSR